MRGVDVELITSRQNDRVKQVIRLCDSARSRRESGLCVAHGVKLCMEATRLGRPVVSLWATGQALAQYSAELAPIIESAQNLYTMTDSVCQKLSPLREPQGVVAVVEMPKACAAETVASQKRVVALDAIQDPGNAGAIIRTAAALGYSILCTEDCADPFSPKALRASMGAAFASDIALCANLIVALRELKGRGHILVATAMSETAQDIRKIDRTGFMTLVIGNEGAGLTKEVVDACDYTALIPITDRAESLNASVAAGIAMWEMRQ